MTPDLVIFDCDGVLVDTEPTTNAALAANLSRYGLPMSAERCFELFVGGTMKGVMGKAREMGADLPDGWLDEIYSEMFDALRRGVAVIAGVMPVLDRLERDGVAMAIVSNGPLEKMAITLAPSGLLQRFEGRIYSPHSHGAPKPDPELLLLAAKAAGVAPERAVMIDDNPSGIVAAERAGMRAIGFDELGDPGRLLKLGVPVATTMVEVAAHLGYAEGALLQEP